MQIIPGEELLMAGCARGDENCLEALGVRYGRPVYAFLLGALGGDAPRARRLLVQSFRTVLSELEPFEESIPFVVKVLQKIRKTIKKWPVLTEKDGTLPWEGEGSSEWGAVLKSLLGLNPRERLLLLARDQLGYSLEEITAALGEKKKHLKKRIEAARLKFKNTGDLPRTGKDTGTRPEGLNLEPLPGDPGSAVPVECPRGLLPDFLEDRVEEPVRETIREHLILCPRCEDEAARSGTLAGSLRRLAQAPLPFRLTEALRSSADGVTSPKAYRRILHQQRSSVRWRVAGIVATVACLAGIGIFVRASEAKEKKVLLLKIQRAIQAAQSGPQTATHRRIRIRAADGRLLVIDLTGLTAEDLRRAGFTVLGEVEAPLPGDPPVQAIVLGMPEALDPAQPQPEKTSAGAQEPDPASLPEVDKIQPFHFHFFFKSTGSRKAFRAMTKKLARRVAFESPDFLVLTFDREALLRWAVSVSEHPELKHLPPAVESQKLPRFKSPVLVSFLLGVIRKELGPKDTLEWHLRFHLSNASAFQTSLRGEGFKFLLETEDLWLLEMTGDEFLKLLRMKSECDGLEVEMGSFALPPSETFSDRVRIALYLAT